MRIIIIMQTMIPATKNIRNPPLSNFDFNDPFNLKGRLKIAFQDSGPPALPDLTGLLGAVGSVLPGLLQLVQAKVALVNNILSNKEFQERIGETIEVGGNLVHRIVIPVASRVVPVAIDLVGKVPELISAGQNFLSMGAGTLSRTPEFTPERGTAGGEVSPRNLN